MSRAWLAGALCLAFVLASTSKASAYTVVATTSYGTVYNENESIGGGSYNVDWYVPTGTAIGWVFLQHGFSRGARNLRNMGLALMNKGLMVLSVNCSVSGGNNSLARAMADSIVDAPPAPPVGTRPQWLIVSGHSAGGMFAANLGKRLVERGYANWRGLVLYDPVDGAFNGTLGSQLQASVNAGKKVLAILANGSACNTFNNAWNPLKNLTGLTYVGFQLKDSAKHTDVEGTNDDIVSALACGNPRSENIARVQDFGSTYSRDLALNTTTATHYPGGATLENLVTAGKAKKIK